MRGRIHWGREAAEHPREVARQSVYHSMQLCVHLLNCDGDLEGREGGREEEKQGSRGNVLDVPYIQLG